jgi:hypothetical protein
VCGIYEKNGDFIAMAPKQKAIPHTNPVIVVGVTPAQDLSIIAVTTELIKPYIIILAMKDIGGTPPLNIFAQITPLC